MKPFAGALAVAIAGALGGPLVAQQISPADVPKPTATTPQGCQDEANAYDTARRKALPPPDDPSLTAEKRAALLREIADIRFALRRACASQFDPATIATSQLGALIQLYSSTDLLDQGQIAIDRAVAMLPTKSIPAADRIAVVQPAINLGARLNRPPAWREAAFRNIEALIDEIDSGNSTTFGDRWSLHAFMKRIYAASSVEAGVIRHSNWMIAAAAKFSPADRNKYGSAVVSAYISLAETYAGQGTTDKALQLLRAAKSDWRDVTGIDASVNPVLSRYERIGAKATAITAPIWLNAPAGTSELAMTGHTTLLEFTAHWCGPCRESYVALSKLQERFKGTNFRIVLVTRLWGYFDAERGLSADEEIKRDKNSFAEHKLNVPVAIGRTDPKGLEPNEVAYDVRGWPQIVLIDSKGTIRTIIVGYDESYEERLVKMIGALLQER